MPPARVGSEECLCLQTNSHLLLCNRNLQGILHLFLIGLYAVSGFSGEASGGCFCYLFDRLFEQISVNCSVKLSDSNPRQNKDHFNVKVGPGPQVKGLLEITPAKKCSMGPYLTQSGPNHEMCKKMWSTKEGRAQIADYTCLNGQCGVDSGMIPPGKFLEGNPPPGKPWGVGEYNGMPLHFEYTPESDANWNNPRCNPPILRKDRPQVL